MNQEDLERFWRNAHDLQVVIDAAGIYLSVNPATERLLGWTPEEMIGRNLFEFLRTDDDGAGSKEALRQAISQPLPAHRNCYRHKDGSNRWIEWRTVPEAGVIYCFGRDVSAETQQTSSLEQATALGTALQQQVTDAHSDADRVKLALAAGAIIGTWVWDIPTDRFTIDDAFARAFGLDPALGREGIPLAGIIATVHPDDQKDLIEAIDEAVTKGGRYAHQYRVRRHDGRYHWLEANGHVEHAPDGTPLRFPGVLMDVEARRAIEKERERAIAALRDLNADLEGQVLERTFARGRTWQISSDLLSVIDGNGRFETINPAWTATLGWSAEELTGSAFAEFVHPDDMRETLAVWADAIERGMLVARFQNRYRHKDGGWRWLSWSAVPDGGKVYGSARDVTVEVEQASLLKETQAREERARQDTLRLQASLAAGAIIGSWNWNFDEDFFTFDEGFAKAFGHELSYAQTGMPIDQVLVNVHPEDRPRLDAAIADTIERGGSYALQYRVRRADGKFYWLEASGRIDVDADGVANSFPGFIVDIDERVSLEAERDRAAADLRALSNTLESRVAERTAELMQVEEALRHSQKMEAIGQLTGGVAHDFNNLLTVIRGSVDLLRRPELTDERRAKYIDAIGDTADRAARLTGQLLAFARRQALTPELFDVGTSIDQVGGMVRTLAGSRIDLVLVPPKVPLFVLADRSQLDTAVVNLAINGRDAMGGEGRLTIAIGAVSNLPARRAHEEIAGDFVAIAITDEGVGIAEDDVERVFEPFFTTKAAGHGTGLGLSQVIGFAKQSGGDVTVESTPGERTTFTLYLPRVEHDGTAKAQGNVEVRGDGAGVCVLVVEDNADVGEFATSALGELGFDSVLARDGAEALAELEKDCARFHILFTDVVMPGIDGVELARCVRAHPRLPVVLTSGYSHVLAENGTHGFELLHKPYSVEQLARVLHKAIRWHEREEQVTA